MNRLVIHVLAVRGLEEDHCVVVGKIRLGELSVPSTLSFSPPDGKKHTVELTEVRDRERFLVLRLEGEKEALLAVEGGFYLYGGKSR